MQNVELSPHFKLNEFCNTSRGAEYIEANRKHAMNPQNLLKLTDLAIYILEPLRAALIDPNNKFGVRSMIISSGVRSPLLNSIIKNASTSSQHLACSAADFVINGKLEDTCRFFLLIKNGKIPNLNMKMISQCILERSQKIDKSWSPWIHIGLMTKEFTDRRVAINKNYRFEPEFFVSLEGSKYVLPTENNLAKYVLQ